MTAWIPWVVLLGLTGLMAAYLRSEGKTQRKLVAEQQAVLGEVLSELASLHSALVASGAVERLARLPPPSPSAAGSKPAGLPRRVVPVTKDNDPVHTRKTMEIPAADALVALTKPEEPPSTKPSESRPRPVPVGDQVDRAQVRRWEARAAELRAEIEGPPPPPSSEAEKAAIRAQLEREADEKDQRDGVQLDVTMASAQPPEAIRIAEAAGTRPPDEEGDVTLRAEGRPTGLPKANEDDEGERVTDEEGTKVWSKSPGEADAQIPGVPVVRKPVAKGLQGATKRPVDPLAGAPLERPVSSASRTAQKGRRPTLLGGLLGQREPSWVEKRTDQLVGQGVDAVEARHQAEEEGRLANAAPGAARPPTPTPTEPGREKIDARIERRWHQKIAAAQEAGKDARHCDGQRCLQEGRDLSACLCQCNGCRIVVALLVQAGREIRAEEDWRKP